MRGSHLSRTRTFTAVLALAAAGAVTLSGCGQNEQKVTPAAPPKKQDAFEQRADQIVRDWPKVSPVHGRQQALLPLVKAERPAKTSAREITVTVGHSACDVRFGARSHESKDLVVITGWGKRKSAKGMCTEQLATDKVTVHLKSALDGRKVVDAATGKQLVKG
ncbi:hypothetical protein SAMN05428945_3615 [Streptomyces sp. 2224.1]|uniref:hypothetical protein n=1 Tax=unclassified Streptomyces TaxID=2593676 RepID=UPI000883ED4F|nr:MULTISPECIES: hypothetical protein [unclassified Streptomyces]PBC81839.1 hypothetical protein BX261_1721 [Streptomyces sp. 2321.6]SDR52857.1 hypothetical protein SAMN05216511_5494 [Streptomyces sp. KS_16]SEC32795.1 hypothetical protein SAMN05428940_1723 [Streptomyces sp. 2133.1]SEC69814.1 hypothetical protein SAMN05428945_3615 [Streptomyces sp. 2224.1]SEF04752.1 hypothetical protein SAMN05428954_5558 [Streptomyces sp. 2112.3]